MNELIRCGIIIQHIPENEPCIQMDFDAENSLVKVSTACERPVPEFPSAQEVNVHLWNQRQHPGAKLYKIAEMAKGFSGRELRRLPLMALALHTFGDPSTVDQALEALMIEVEQRRHQSQPGIDDFSTSSL